MDKKLTDKEIVKALERLIEVTSKDILISNNGVTYGNVLDLINRLQEENEKNENIIRIADKTIETQEKEINLLNKDNEEFQNLIVQYNKDFAEQEAEIERLKAEIFNYKNSTLVSIFEKAKAEAYKECIEKVKPIISDIVELMFDGNISKCQLPSCHKPSSIPCESEICIKENKEYWHGKLDNLLKELVGETDV